MSTSPHSPPPRPNLYPVQTWTARASRDNSTLSPDPEPLQLPTTIHAVQDSRDTHPPGRTIVICLDGTGDKYDSDNSNVVNFVACLKKDSVDQVTYYQSGIGTYGKNGLSKGISASIDMAIGSGLGVHVREAYAFIMQNYKEGDRICLLGFSRGAYTVRCLAGMLHKVGLLPASNKAQIPFAYRFYKDDTPEGWKMSAGFKETFCTNVNVYFVGIWDCVAAVGFFPRVLPFSRSATNSIAYFRHAMALDEHRAKFKVCQYQHNDPTTAPAVNKEKEAYREKHMNGGRPPRRISFGPPSRKNTGEKGLNGHARKLSTSSDKTDVKDDNDQTKLEQIFEKEDRTVKEIVTPNVQEVWFAGAHADCGGGAVANEERHQLSRIPLRWMIRQCFECNTGILFNTADLAEAGIDIPTVWPIYFPQKKPICGPSPATVEKYEAGELPPIQRRSTALGVDKKLKKLAHKGKFVPPEAYSEEQLRQLADHLLPEQVEDHFDAIAPINDQLVVAKGWWILEIWPVKIKMQEKATGAWKKVTGMNLGRYRPVLDTEPKMHWSVDLRMREKGYKIRNEVERGALWQIVA